MTYLEIDLINGNGLSSTRSMKAFTYDGHSWHTCELSDFVRGEPLAVFTVPSTSRGGWVERQS